MINELNSVVNNHRQKEQYLKEERRASRLDTDEAGFSAIEEEVKSNATKNRPTVYAGQSKFERTEPLTYSSMIDKLYHTSGAG